jgi:hypothetical protein
MVGLAFAVFFSALEITMSNIEQRSESAVEPQRKPNLDMASHIASTSASQVRHGDEGGAKVRVPLGELVPW